jgi:hypothetical protein
MKPRTAYLLAGLTVLAGAGVLSGVRALMVLGGLPLGLLLPGAALSALLFRSRQRLVAIERIMLIPVLSLATLVLGGLLLWAARAPLYRATWLALSAGVTLAALAAVVVRDRTNPAGSGSAVASVRGRARLRQVLPAVLSVLMLAGAVTLSFTSSIRSQEVTVTTLSVVPPGAGDSTGKRSVQVDATGLSGGASAYRLVVTTAKGTGDTSVAITADGHGGWTSTLQLPSDDRLTLGLYRAGDTTALRTVIIASAATS